MKKLFSLFLCVLIFCSAVFSVTAEDNNSIYNNKNWSYELLADSSIKLVKYSGKENKVEVPKQINGFTVSEIGSYCFYNSKIEKITLPSSIKKIGYWSFYGSKVLSKVQLNNGLNVIYHGAFMNCPSLKSMVIPPSVYAIDNDAFAISCSTKTNIKDFATKNKISTQSYTKLHDFVIKGFGGTMAEKYANDNGLNFENSSNLLFGDVNCDGVVDKADVKSLSDTLSKNQPFSNNSYFNADVDANGTVNEADKDLIEQFIENKISYNQFPVAQNLAESFNYLDGKRIYCNGDSIAKGTGTNILGNSFYSYCNYVSERGNMIMTNKAIAGTTLAKRKGRNDSILERVRSMTGEYDVVMLDGGYNDLFRGLEVGSLTSSNDFSGKYDEYTTAGALESICYFLNTNYKDADKLFVLCHDVVEFKDQQPKYWNVIKKVLDKWKINYIDISEITDFSNVKTEITNQYFRYTSDRKKGDGIHPLEYAARKIYGPLIYERLNKIVSSSDIIDFDEKNVSIGVFESYNQQPALKTFDNSYIRYSSDNPSIATVDENGVVVPSSFGTTKIRACTFDGKTADYTVTVDLMLVNLSNLGTKMLLNMFELPTLAKENDSKFIAI